MGDSTNHLRPKHFSARNRRCSGNTILKSVFTILPTFARIFAFVDSAQNTLQGQDASVEAMVQQDAMRMVPLPARYLVLHKASFQSSVVVLPDSQCHKELAK